jgi:hypothetical protein
MKLSLSLFTLIFISTGFALKKQRYLIFSIAFVAILAIWISEFNDLFHLQGISWGITIVLFAIVVVNLIIQIVNSSRVDASVIIAAINGYLLIGFLFTLMIAFVHSYDPGGFSFKTEHPGFPEYSYFSLVTLSTLGYGDIVPLKPFTKSLATFTSISGQIYLAVIIALLVGKFAATQHKED